MCYPCNFTMPSGKLVDVITSHNGQEEDLGDRLLQTEAIAHMADNATKSDCFLRVLGYQSWRGKPSL